MSQLSHVLAHISAVMSQIALMLPQVSIEMLLIAGRAVFLVFSFVIAAVTFSRWRREAQRNTEQLATQNGLVLERLAAIEERVAATNFRVAELASQMESEQRAASAADSAAPRYEVAIRLARGGASRDELIASCGLSRQEADLVERVHAPDRRSTRPQAAA
jgi:Protein of unknown function (DUF2802)